MSLKNKLARLGSPAAQPGGSVAADTGDASIQDLGRAERVARLRERIASIGRGRRGKGSGRPLATAGKAPRPDTLPGESRVTEHGTLRLLDRTFDVDQRHGDVLLADALRVDAALLAKLALDESLATVDAGRLLFLDTETTGLAGGTGTLAFLVGLGWFEEGAFRLQQMLVPAPGEEASMLRALAARMAWASAIVTYNGKSFDWPLLRTRFVLNRVPQPQLAVHLDLLHGMRRIYGKRLGRVRLTEVERRVLGFERVDDIDGALIPERYFAYLRGADGDCLAPVVEHNAYDIMALAAMIAEAGAGMLQPERLNPTDRLALARLELRNHNLDGALAAAQGAAAACREDATTVEALQLSARLLTRQGAYHDAAAALQEALALADDPWITAELHLALAKLFEHRLKDTECALHHAAHTATVEGKGAQRHRQTRLKRRLKRQRVASASAATAKK